MGGSSLNALGPTSDQFFFVESSISDIVSIKSPIFTLEFIVISSIFSFLPRPNSLFFFFSRSKTMSPIQSISSNKMIFLSNVMLPRLLSVLYRSSKNTLSSCFFVLISFNDIQTICRPV